MKAGLFKELCLRACKRADFSYATVQGIAEYSGGAIYITFRATDSREDWRNHFDCAQLVTPYATEGGAKIHRGWIEDYMGVREKILAAIYRLPSIPIFVTGHSYGGADASICALDIAYNFPSADVSLVTFNAPLAGNRVFVRDLARYVPKSIHYVYGSDVISNLPPRPLGYRKYRHTVHVGKVDWLFVAMGTLLVASRWIVAKLSKKPFDFFEFVVAKDHLLGAFDDDMEVEFEVEK